MDIWIEYRGMVPILCGMCFNASHHRMSMLPQENQRKELAELFSGDQSEEAFEDFEASPDDEREHILCIIIYIFTIYIY